MISSVRKTEILRFMYIWEIIEIHTYIYIKKWNSRLIKMNKIYRQKILSSL